MASPPPDSSQGTPVKREHSSSDDEKPSPKRQPIQTKAVQGQKLQAQPSDTGAGSMRDLVTTSTTTIAGPSSNAPTQAKATGHSQQDLQHNTQTFKNPTFNEELNKMYLIRKQKRELKTKIELVKRDRKTLEAKRLDLTAQLNEENKRASTLDKTISDYEANMAGCDTEWDEAWEGLSEEAMEWLSTITCSD